MEVAHVGVFAGWLECVKCCRCRCCDGCRRCYSRSHYTARLDMNGNGVLEATSVLLPLPLSLPASTRPACLASVGVQFRSALSKIRVYTFTIHVKCCSSTTTHKHTYIQTYVRFGQANWRAWHCVGRDAACLALCGKLQYPSGSLGRWWRRTFVYDHTAHTSASSTFDLQITWVNIINGPANPMRKRARNV